MGQALDAILREGSIHWRSTKEETLEALIKAWAQHRNTLIIAHSNREVKALNELARLYRREAGELCPTEYQCETAYGTLYISEGDRIELRKNDPELGFNNGTTGILIKASEKSFTLQIKEGSQTRQVNFDPRHYRSFQLAYATTYYRSQGRSAERVFVLHSPQMNKEMFYVGLTRHFKKVECFVSQQDAKNITDLKRQAYRQSPRASTCEYTTESELSKLKAQEDRKQQINSLKNSESFLDKTKWVGLSAWQEIQNKTSKWIEKQKDKQPDTSFFNPVLEKDLPKGIVKEVQFEEELHINDQKVGQGLARVQTMDSNVIRPAKEFTRKLSEDKSRLLKKYFKSLEHASTLYTIVKSEEESGNKSPHYHEWQKACGERNAHAFEIMNALNKKELRTLFNPKNLDILQERASKHEQLHQQESSLAELNTKLTENLDSLLFRLYPEGPTRQDSKGLRFGTKGSLAVSHTGSFYDFEKGEGGGPLQLIQRNLSCSTSKAIAWAKDFLGQAPTLSAPTHFSIKKEREQEWISLKPNTNAPASFKLSNYQEKERYPYKDHNGELLFYTIRLEDESGKKIVLPLSYGYYKGNAEHPTWSFKGYQAAKKPLYNIHLLQEFPNSKVLIVEGEKTANAASKMFSPEKMICLTWSGGAGAVQKSDWATLFMRDVVIWPDNDKTGFGASTVICQELRRVGVGTLREVDKELLAKHFPTKWDLADPLHQGKNDSLSKT
jgi:hypothetical protein